MRSRDADSGTEPLDRQTIRGRASSSSPHSRFARCTWPRPILRKPRRSRTRCSADIAGRRWIWAPAFLVELAHVLHRLGRGDDFLRATAAAYATPWLESARAIGGGDFVRAADVLAGIGSRPDEAYARLLAAETLLAEGRRAEADEQLAQALEFFRSVRATRYLAHGERLVASSAELDLGSSGLGRTGG